jgi:hypothetical protein
MKRQEHKKDLLAFDNRELSMLDDLLVESHHLRSRTGERMSALGH